MKKTENLVIIASKAPEGNLNFQIRTCEGRWHFLMQHRFNSCLYGFYDTGVTINRIRMLKPKRTAYSQILFHFSSYLLKLTDKFTKDKFR